MTTTTTQQLKPASLAEISAALQMLFDALPFQRGAGSDNATASYIEAVRSFSIEAIQAGISKFLRGECEHVSTRFVPTPPELARIVRSAVVPQRVPAERRLPSPPRMEAGERARMRLKMPMLRHAFGSREMMDDLDRANREGFAAMVVLAGRWGVAVPDEFNDMSEEEAERGWREARSRAWAEIDRNPPPYLRTARRKQRNESAE